MKHTQFIRCEIHCHYFALVLVEKYENLSVIGLFVLFHPLESMNSNLMFTFTHQNTQDILNKRMHRVFSSVHHPAFVLFFHFFSFVTTKFHMCHNSLPRKQNNAKMFAKMLRMRNENEIYKCEIDGEQQEQHCAAAGMLYSNNLPGHSKEVKRFNLLLFKCVENLNIHQMRL